MRLRSSSQLTKSFDNAGSNATTVTNATPSGASQPDHECGDVAWLGVLDFPLVARLLLFIYGREQIVMGHNNLAEFVQVLERAGELKRIQYPVRAELEIAEIADRVMKANGPALLFENVVGKTMPLLINAFGSMKRMALALGVDDVEIIAGSPPRQTANSKRPDCSFCC